MYLYYYHYYYYYYYSVVQVSNKNYCKSFVVVCIPSSDFCQIVDNNRINTQTTIIAIIIAVIVTCCDTIRERGPRPSPPPQRRVTFLLSSADARRVIIDSRPFFFYPNASQRVYDGIRIPIGCNGAGKPKTALFRANKIVHNV